MNSALHLLSNVFDFFFFFRYVDLTIVIYGNQHLFEQMCMCTCVCIYTYIQNLRMKSVSLCFPRWRRTCLT